MAADTNPKRAERLPDHAPDPTVRAARRNLHRSDGADAFLPDPAEEGHGITDPDASFAEEFIASATAGEPVEQDANDEVAEDEDGGPYLIETEPEDVELPSEDLENPRDR